MRDWWDAEPRLVPPCPYCEEEREIERVGDRWRCVACAKSWPALTRNDKRMLKGLHIAVEEW